MVPTERRHRARGVGPVLAGVLMALLAGCSSSGGVAASSPSPHASPPGPSVASPPSSGESAGGTSSPRRRGQNQPTKLLVAVLENHSAQQAMDGMPWLAAAASRYGTARHSFALTHPSLPNYLAIVGGDTFAVRDDDLPAAHPLRGPSVFGQILAAGKVAKTYVEGMTTPCQLRSGGRYAAKHNPWAYFSSPTERAGCRRQDVPAGTPASGALHHDIVAGTLPTFGLLVPDLCNDAHDCSLRTADRWLRSWLAPLIAAPDFRSGRLAVVVTFDEDDRHAGNNIFTVVLDQHLHGKSVAARIDHLSLSRSISSLVGGHPLRNAADSTDLLSAFGL